MHLLIEALVQYVLKRFGAEQLSGLAADLIVNVLSAPGELAGFWQELKEHGRATPQHASAILRICEERGIVLPADAHGELSRHSEPASFLSQAAAAKP